MTEEPRDAAQSSVYQVSGADLFNFVSAVLRVINPDLLDHSRRVAVGSRALAQALGWPEKAVGRVYLGGLVHDLGYLALQANVYRRWSAKEEQEPAEAESTDSHPVLGERILAGVSALAPLRPITRHHHEHYDGSGYPDGLAGKAIPVEARLLAVVDFFERVTVSRSGLVIMSVAEAVEILKEDAGIIYDPVLAAVFLERVLPTGVMEPPQV